MSATANGVISQNLFNAAFQSLSDPEDAWKQWNDRAVLSSFVRQRVDQMHGNASSFGFILGVTVKAFELAGARFDQLHDSIVEMCDEWLLTDPDVLLNSSFVRLSEPVLNTEFEALVSAARQQGDWNPEGHRSRVAIFEVFAAILAFVTYSQKNMQRAMDALQEDVDSARSGV